MKSFRVKRKTLCLKPIGLLIRESDYRKQLRQTEPLTFGDKFSNYKLILAFGVRRSGPVQLRTIRPGHEPTHTNPNQRTFLLGVPAFLLGRLDCHRSSAGYRSRLIRHPAHFFRTFALPTVEQKTHQHSYESENPARRCP
ncbi:hypothetical protein [Spirosoma humi]